MFLEILKAVIYGIVEGITEWLPISSTGHLILLEQWLPLKASDGVYGDVRRGDPVGRHPGRHRAVFPQAESVLSQKEPAAEAADLDTLV